MGEVPVETAFVVSKIDTVGFGEPLVVREVPVPNNVVVCKTDFNTVVPVPGIVVVDELGVMMAGVNPVVGDVDKVASGVVRTVVPVPTRVDVFVSET